MAGLDRAGFTSATYDEIVSRIQARLEQYNPGFDFSPDSPDGQLIDIFSLELTTVWEQLGLVYNSYNPQTSSGAALRNLGLITGLPFGVADRSYAVIDLVGTAGSLVPAGSIVSNAATGVEYYTAFDASVGGTVTAIATVAGANPIIAGTIDTIVTAATGWSSVSQALDGIQGRAAQTEAQFRNSRIQSVMRNAGSTVDQMAAKLFELGLSQVSIYNNDTSVPVGSQPANSVAVTVGEVGDITDEEIGTVILRSNSIGCPTHGTTTVNVDDSQGVTHAIKFTKAVGVPVIINANITFLSDNVAGAQENIRQALYEHVNSLNSGEAVVWSRLFGVITPYAKAQVNSLTITRVSPNSPAQVNLPMTDGEFASILSTDINLTVV